MFASFLHKHGTLVNTKRKQQTSAANTSFRLLLLYFSIMIFMSKSLPPVLKCWDVKAEQNRKIKLEHEIINKPIRDVVRDGFCLPPSCDVVQSHPIGKGKLNKNARARELR